MAEKTKVTRIKANDDAKAPKVASASKTAVKAVKSQKASKVKAIVDPNDTDEKKGFFKRVADYFKGAWFELRQVRWPTRKATWGLTLAVILFSAFFVTLILLLDAAFKYLFEQFII